MKSGVVPDRNGGVAFGANEQKRGQDAAYDECTIHTDKYSGYYLKSAPVGIVC